MIVQILLATAIWIDVTTVPGFHGDGINDDSPALNSVTASLQPGDYLWIPSDANITLESTWNIHNKDSVTIQGSAKYGTFVTYEGIAGGTAISIDKTSNSRIGGFKIYSGSASTAIDIDKTASGGGNTTGLILDAIAIDTGNATSGRISIPEFVGIYISRVSRQNCENILIRNCTLAGGQTLDDPLNGTGLRIGSSANAKDIRFVDGFVGYFWRGIWSQGGNVKIAGNLTTGNLQDFVLEGSTSATTVVSDNISEAQQQFAVIGGANPVVILRNTINAGSWSDGTATIEVQDSVRLTLMNNEWSSPFLGQQVLTNSGHAYSPTLVAIGNSLPNNNVAKLGLDDFRGYACLYNFGAGAAGQFLVSDAIQMPGLGGLNAIAVKTNTALPYTRIAPGGTALAIGEATPQGKLRVYENGTTAGISVVFDDATLQGRYVWSDAGNKVNSFYNVRGGPGGMAVVKTTDGINELRMETISGARQEILWSGTDLGFRQNGTNWMTITKDTGLVKILGTVQPGNYQSKDGSLGISTNITIGSNIVVVKNGIITGVQ